MGCGSSDSTDASGPSTGAAPAAATTDPRPRAGRLLDTWSKTLLTTLLAARDRGQAAQARDQAAYNDADAKLRPSLRKVKRFAAQGRAVMSQFADGPVRKAIVADGDAWQEWAMALLEPGEVSLTKGRRIADLGSTAFAAHEEAYRVVGKTPPPAFQRRADQK